MANADQAGHRGYIPFLPAGTPKLEAYAQGLRFPFHLTAADRAAGFEVRRVVEAVPVLRAIAEQPIRCAATALPFCLLGYRQQFTYPLADPGPSVTRQQAAALSISDPCLLRLFPMDALGTLAQRRAGVKEIERLHTTRAHPLHRLPNPTRAIGQRLHVQIRRASC